MAGGCMLEVNIWIGMVQTNCPLRLIKLSKLKKTIYKLFEIKNICQHATAHCLSKFTLKADQTRPVQSHDSPLQSTQEFYHISEMGANNWTLQQDNDLKHTTNSNKDCIRIKK
ncbi:hypothetical protein CHARACLAT_013662 [Characodon lateralis]|uniref:Uncharacterized protein n=1 Tax=Characodon lateralis TaxID=208331 RepID=A0ABU7DGB4_9TELE|nr:hypothetical protein [Characodon lateralis]